MIKYDSTESNSGYESIARILIATIAEYERQSTDAQLTAITEDLHAGRRVSPETMHDFRRAADNWESVLSYWLEELGDLDSDQAPEQLYRQGRAVAYQFRRLSKYAREEDSLPPSAVETTLQILQESEELLEDVTNASIESRGDNDARE